MAAESIFNYFVGGLALLSTVFSMLVYLNVYLPGPRMKAFDEILAETKNIYEKACTEGLLPPDMSRKALIQLQEYEHQADDLRAITYRRLSPIDVLLSFFGGHSSKIAGLSSDLVELRGDLLTTSQKERARRRGALLVQERNVSAGSLPHSMVGQGGSGCGGPGISQISGTVCVQATQGASLHECCHQPESASHPTTEDINATSSPSANNHSLLSNFRYSTFCVGSLMQWLSWNGPSSSPSQPECEDYDQRTSLSEIGPYSRSATLVEDPFRKDSSLHRPWWLLAWGVRPADTRTRREDVEARLDVPNPLGSHYIWRALSEP